MYIIIISLCCIRYFIKYKSFIMPVGKLTKTVYPILIYNIIFNKGLH